MDTIIKEIRRALDAGLYYIAVVGALSLPDVCAAMESSDGTSSGAQYRSWYNNWLAPKYPRITADDIWSLRCGVLHQGRFGHPRMQYDRVLFTIPDGRGTVLHNNIMSDALNLDARWFCSDVLESVSRWSEAKRSDPIVQGNMGRLLKLHPHGLPPYITGVPVIA